MTKMYLNNSRRIGVHLFLQRNLDQVCRLYKTNSKRIFAKQICHWYAELMQVRIKVLPSTMGAVHRGHIPLMTNWSHLIKIQSESSPSLVDNGKDSEIWSTSRGFWNSFTSILRIFALKPEASSGLNHCLPNWEWKYINQGNYFMKLTIRRNNF